MPRPPGPGPASRRPGGKPCKHSGLHSDLTLSCRLDRGRAAGAGPQASQPESESISLNTAKAAVVGPPAGPPAGLNSAHGPGLTLPDGDWTPLTCTDSESYHDPKAAVLKPYGVPSTPGPVLRRDDPVSRATARSPAVMVAAAPVAALLSLRLEPARAQGSECRGECECHLSDGAARREGVAAQLQPAPSESARAGRVSVKPVPGCTRPGPKAAS